MVKFLFLSPLKFWGPPFPRSLSSSTKIGTDWEKVGCTWGEMGLRRFGAALRPWDSRAFRRLRLSNFPTIGIWGVTGGERKGERYEMDGWTS